METNITPTTPYSGYPGQNLSFMIDFLMALGVNPFQYGKMTDSPNNYETQLRKSLKDDDMKISKAHRLLNAIGYELGIDFEEPTKEKDTKYTLTLPQDLGKENQDKIDNNLLRFLVEYMNKYKISKAQLARDIGVSTGAVMAWLKVDDMYLSQLNLVSDRYGLKLHYTITRQK